MKGRPPSFGMKSHFRQEVALNLCGKIEVPLESIALRISQVVEAVAD